MFLPEVRSSGSDFGERTGPNPGSESGFGERTWPYTGSAGSEFGERTRPNPCFEVIKLEYSLKLKIKPIDLVLADMCPQAANYCALF